MRSSVTRLVLHGPSFRDAVVAWTGEDRRRVRVHGDPEQLVLEPSARAGVDVGQTRERERGRLRLGEERGALAASEVDVAEAEPVRVPASALPARDLERAPSTG